MTFTIIIIIFLGIVYFMISDRENGYKHLTWLIGDRGDWVASETFNFLDGLDAAEGSSCKITVTKGQLLFTVIENTYKIGRAQLKGAYVFGENTIIENASADSKNPGESGIDFKHLSEIVCALNGAGLKKPMDEKHYMIISYQSSAGNLKTVMLAPVKEDNMAMGSLFAFVGRINKTYELNVKKIEPVQVSPDDFIQL